jgi:hypothetical protein
VDVTIDDLPGRIESALLGALAGEAAAGTAAGAADLLGVAESAAASGGFDEADLRHRGLERPSRSGSAGLLLRGLPFALFEPANRPRLRRDAYRCVSLAGADEGTAVTAMATALLCADLLRFDLETAVIRVRQSLLEDAPMGLLQRLSLTRVSVEAADGDPGAALQGAIGALSRETTVAGVIAAAEPGPIVARSLAGALAGAHRGRAALEGIDVSGLAHADRAVNIAERLAVRLGSGL